MNISELEKKCKAIRRHIINMTCEAGSGHPGGSLSMVEAMVALFFDRMRIDPMDPKKADRDRFVLSKGHAAPCYYAVLAERGFFDPSELVSLRKLGSFLQGHPDSKKCPGVDASSGSLGQGFGIATGMALGAKLSGNLIKVYTICGDGELQEGLIWEAAEAAAHYKLDNLTVIVDNNGLQIDGSNDEVMKLGDIRSKFEAFGFEPLEVEDGNNIEQMLAALNTPKANDKPRMILAHTLKGKGVSFMEGQVGWHGKAPDAEQRMKALKELEG